MSPRIQRRSLADAPILHDTNIAAVLRRVYAGRGVQSASEVDLRLAHLLPPTLGDLDRACEHLLRWREAQAHITVVGDFDADGATGTAVAVRGLRLLGFQRVDYRVPNRFLHGYGLSPAVVDALDPAPNVILTVDNGVAALAGVTAAKSRGIEVLITDHHLPAETLPDAVAIVNPNRHGDAFPSKALAGVGVVFYLLIALRARLRELGSPQGQVDLSTLLDLVAIGTVADLVALDANNRRLVRAGLQRIREERAHAGVLALFRAAGRDPRRATAADLGFAIGPRINAAGRLEDMALGIECLLCDDALRADAFAQRLNNINHERRDLQQAMVDQAEALLEARLPSLDAAHVPAGLVLHDADWHSGVIGLVASKLKERLHRPIIACAPAEDGSGEWKGSGRSIPGFHLRDCLVALDTRHPGLLKRYGGHAMAAGLSIDGERLPELVNAFEQIASEWLSPELLQATIWTDGPLRADEISLSQAEALRAGGPWGQAFPEPLFDNEFELERWSVMAERHLRLNLRLLPERHPVEAIFFNAYRGEAPQKAFRAAYQLEIDEWRGEPRLRLMLRHWE